MERADATLEATEIVAALYRGLLRREADPSGLDTYVSKLRLHRDLESVLRNFLESDEYKAISNSRQTPSFPLDSAPSMSLQMDYGAAAEHDALWNHIASVWSEYGRSEPYWSVVTAERWRAANITDEQALAAFYATGKGERERLDAWLQRNALPLGQDNVCAEYGCGVGRITAFLASRFRHVIAFDVSQAHLDTARRRLEGRGIANVEYVLVRDERDLQLLACVDLFYSILVLQHNPPPIIVDILSHAFKGLNPDGVAFFQIPTYSRDYAFSLERYLARTAGERTMEMHFVPQRLVLQLGQRHNVFPVEIQPDWCIGNHDRWISSTFLMTKRDIGRP